MQALPYFNRSRISDVKVSPSNTHAAFLWVDTEGQRLLAVIDLADPKNARGVFGHKQLDVRNFHWINDRRLVFDMVPPGLEIFEGEAGTFAIDLDGQRQELLLHWTFEVRQPMGTRIRNKVLP